MQTGLRKESQRLLAIALCSAVFWLGGIGQGQAAPQHKSSLPKGVDTWFIDPPSVTQGTLSSSRGGGVSWPQIEFSPEDRILILAPHPDDEVIGCAGIIQKAAQLHLPVRIVFLTYGDNNEWSFLVYRKHPVIMSKSAQKMGLVRHDEAVAAAKELGLPENKLTFLGYPDFRNLTIWYYHWGKRPPAKSLLTRVNKVSYPNALRPGTPYKGEEILDDLKKIVRTFRPTKIFISHPADQNGDHRALYLFTRVALWDLEGDIRPRLYPYLIHFQKWPKPKGERETEQLKPPLSLEKMVSWQTYNLSVEQRACKKSALKAHKSQYNSSPGYLLSFVRRNELFGDFADIRIASAQAEADWSEEAGEKTALPVEQLTDEERATFVGLEKQFVKLEKDTLILSVTLSRPLARGVGFAVYLFGYRPDRPFSQMPKICIRFGATLYRVLDQNRVLPDNTIKARRFLKKITIAVPLEVLGDPQRILTSTSTYLGLVQLDQISWRVLLFSPE